MKNKNRFKDTGNSRTVEGDIVEFGNDEHTNLEDIVDRRETIDAQDVTIDVGIPQLDIKRLYAAYNAVTDICPHLEYHKELPVAELKAAMNIFIPNKKAYCNTISALYKFKKLLDEKSTILNKFSDKDHSNLKINSEMEIPRNTYKYLVGEIKEKISTINQALSEFMPSETENTELQNNIESINNIITDIYSDRKLSHTTIAIEFLKGPYTLLINKINQTSESKIEDMEKCIAAIPDGAIKVIVDNYSTSQPIRITDPAPVTKPAENTLKKVYRKIGDLFQR